MPASTLIPGVARYDERQATHPLLDLHPARDLSTDSPRTLARFAVNHPDVKLATLAGLRRQLRQGAPPEHAALLEVREVGVHEERIWALLAPVGSTLGQHHNTTPPGLERSLDATFRVLSALVTLHAAGHVHRRVSPQSIYCTPSGQAVLAPYSWLAAADAPDFQSPEASIGGTTSTASDLYQVGATLFWLLTGTSPKALFQASLASLRFQRLPPAFVDVIFRATRFDPNSRYRSAVMMAADLQRAADAAASGRGTAALGRALGPRPALPTRRPDLAEPPAPDASPLPALPDNEQDRLATLVSLAVLDTQTEERFDRHTRLAQRLLGTSMALVSLIDSDRQWFKSRFGLEATQTPRELAFCAHAILSPSKLFEVPDATRDPRFRENPLVTGAPSIRFYAGQPLRVQGRAVGTLCVIDHTPRRLTDGERAVLAELAKAVESELTQQEFEDIDPETGLSNLNGFARHAHLALGWRAAEGRSVRLVHITAPSSVPPAIFAAAFQRSHQDADALARLDDLSYCALLPADEQVGPRISRLEADLPLVEQRQVRWVGVTIDPGDHTVLASLVAHAQAQAHRDPRPVACG